MKLFFPLLFIYISIGFKLSDWEIQKVLTSLFWLFSDSYARRREYTAITKSTVFPLRFCSTRWVEDVPVAQRAINIWPNVVKYVRETLKKKKAEIPSCASFTVENFNMYKHAIYSVVKILSFVLLLGVILFAIDV